MNKKYYLYVVGNKFAASGGKIRAILPPLPLISAGGEHSLYTDYTQAWGWGRNDSGRLGDNTTTQRNTPVAVCGGHTFCHISGGISHSLAIDHQGQAWAWGNNTNGRLGDNTTTSRQTPVRVCNL